MSTIIVHYRTQSIDKESVLKNINTWKSDKYKIFMQVHDYSLNCELSKKINDEDISNLTNYNIKLNTVEHAYENFSDNNEHKTILSNCLMETIDSVATIIFNGNVNLIIPIDTININQFKDNHLGLIYTDFTIDNSWRYYLQSEPNPKLMPLIIWSSSAIANKMHESNPLETIFSSYKRFHIANALYNISIDE